MKTKARGRPKKIDDARVARLRKTLSPAAIAKKLGCSLTSVYLALGRVGAKPAPATPCPCCGRKTRPPFCRECNAKAARNGFCEGCNLPKVRKGGKSVCTRCGFSASSA